MSTTDILHRTDGGGQLTLTETSMHYVFAAELVLEDGALVGIDLPRVKPDEALTVARRIVEVVANQMGELPDAAMAEIDRLIKAIGP